MGWKPWKKPFGGRGSVIRDPMGRRNVTRQAEEDIQAETERAKSGLESYIAGLKTEAPRELERYIKSIEPEEAEQRKAVARSLFARGVAGSGVGRQALARTEGRILGRREQAREQLEQGIKSEEAKQRADLEIALKDFIAGRKGEAQSKINSAKNLVANIGTLAAVFAIPFMPGVLAKVGTGAVALGSKFLGPKE